MKIIGRDFLEKILTMPKSIELMELALTLKANGQTEEPLRTIVDPTLCIGRLFVMPAFMRLAENKSFYSVKCLGVFENNVTKGLSSRQGGILLFCGETGQTLAMIDAELITYFRTAAMSAIATKLLAKPDSKHLAIIGTGQQAQYHLKAMLAVRPIEKVKMVGRNFKKCQQLVQTLQKTLDCAIEAVETVAEATVEADIIVAATSATEAVLKYEFVKEGTHINSIGAVKKHARELDDKTMQSAKLFVDASKSVRAETGDWLIPFKKGLFAEQHILAEIGTLWTNPTVFNRQTEDITVFKSVGLSIEDLVMAQYVYSNYVQ